MKIDLKNNVLKQAESQIEGSLTPETRDNYMKVVVAGMKAGLQGGTKSILASLVKSKEPLHDCAVGALNLVSLLSRQSRGTMPVKVMIPAAATLMFHALDFCDKAGIVKVGPQELAQATRIFANQVYHYLNITPQMMQTAATKIQGFMQDPAKMELMKRASGVVKSPLASSPTQVPEEGAA